MTRLLKSESGPFYSLDFKGFDASIRPEVIDKVYDQIGLWFDGEAAPLIEFCRSVCKWSGLLVPGGVYEGAGRTGGIPSGCVMTNLAGSLANYWMLHYAAARIRFGSRRGYVVRAYVQGDDGVAVFSEGVTLAGLSSILLSDLGVTLSREKTLVSDSYVHFLQNVHRKNHESGNFCPGERPIMQAAAAMTVFERVDGPEWTYEYDTIRWSQQIGMTLHHPRSTEFADWLYDSDWCAREVVVRASEDSSFLQRACSAVNRKDSNSFWGLSPNAILTSPVVQYLLKRSRRGDKPGG
jgi:hypothetical protein